MAESRSDTDLSFFKNALDDHVKKAFWALWSASFGSEKITTEQIEHYREFASKIHERRLASLYAPTDEKDILVLPSEEVRHFRNLVEARKNIESNEGEVEYSKERIELTTWFEEINQDPEARKMIWGHKSQEKLIELQSVRAWVTWLKGLFDEAAKESQELTRQEIERKKPEGEERFSPKWKVRIVLFSESHSIRKKAINYWNSHLPQSIRFFAHDKDKSRIEIDVIAPKSMYATDIYPALLFWSQRAMIALSVGTLGYFWWYTPKHREKFFEKVTDLESNAEIRLKRDPPLNIDWPQRAIQDEDISRIAMCFTLLPFGRNDGHWLPFDLYLQSLALMARTDIHIGFQPGIFQKFVLCLCHLAFRFDNEDRKQTPTEILKKVVLKQIPHFDEMEKYVEFSDSILENRKSKIEIQMDDLMKLKLIIDGYILRNFKGEFDKKLKSIKDPQEENAAP